MKKSLFALCASVAVLAACQQPVEPVVGQVTFAEGIETVVPTEGSIINVDFTTNVNWTAEINVDASVASINHTSGEAGENRIKLTVLPLDEDNAQRSVDLTITPENGASAVLTFTQSGPYVPYISVSQDKYELGLEGGSIVITVDANTEYTYSCSEGVQIVEAKTENVCTYTCSVEKNSSWQPLTFGVWFTVPAIQDPVLDDNGEDTGETKDHVESVWFSQGSFSEFAYAAAIPESAFGAKKYSVAVAGDYLVVANGSTVLLFNKADGSFAQDLQIEGVWAIANDDAGNILVLTGDGSYPSEDNPTPAGLTFLVAPVNTFTDTKTWVTINTYKNGFYGLGMDNPTVRGNLLQGDAVVTLASSGGTTYAAFFQFKDGKLMTADGAEAEMGVYTDYVGGPENSGAVWKAKLMSYICVTDKFDGGVLFSGYDAKTYELYYNPTVSRANWVATGLAFGGWDSGISSSDIIEFEGKTLYIGLKMTLFPQWAMASAIEVVDITNIDEPKHLAEISYTAPTSEEAYNSAVLQCEKDGENLAIFIVDGNQQAIGKLCLKPIK